MGLLTEIFGDQYSVIQMRADKVPRRQRKQHCAKAGRSREQAD